MVSVAYSDLHNVLNLTVSDITAVKTEALLDQAIDLLNLYANQSISNMAGSGGSKTVTLTSKQRGAVFEVAKAIYYRDYLSQVPITGEGVSAQVSTTQDPVAVAKEAGFNLITRSILRT